MRKDFATTIYITLFFLFFGNILTIREQQTNLLWRVPPDSMAGKNGKALGKSQERACSLFLWFEV